MSYPSPGMSYTAKVMHTVVWLFYFWSWNSGIFEWCGCIRPHWKLLGFLCGCSIWKTFKQIKTDLHCSSVSVSLLGSTKPQNLKACDHGLGTPALLRELCVTWHCSWQGTVGILIPKATSCWETRGWEVKTSWCQWISIFPWKSVLSEICWWALLQIKLWELSRKGKAGRRQGWL